MKNIFNFGIKKKIRTGTKTVSKRLSPVTAGIPRVIVEEFYFEVLEILLSILDKIEIDLNIEFRCVVGSGATGVTGSNRDEWM